MRDLMGPNGGAPDGWPEVIVCNQQNRSIAVFRNQAAGNWGGDPPQNGLLFEDSHELDSSGDCSLYPYDVKLADLDGANGPDLVISCRCARQGLADQGVLAILLNQGDGVFQYGQALEVSIPFAAEVLGLEIVDLNADGLKDVAVAGMYFGVGGSKPLLGVAYGPSAGWSPEAAPLVQVVRGGTDFVFGFHSSGTDVVSASFCSNPQLGGDLVMSSATMEAATEHLWCRNLGLTPNGAIAWAVERVPATGSAYGLRATDITPNNGDVLSGRIDLSAPDFRGALNLAFGLPGGFCETLAGDVRDFPQLSNAYGIAAKPLDLNANVDVAVACRLGQSAPWTAGGITVFQQRIDLPGEFYATPRDLLVLPQGVTASPHFVRIADLNNDGRNDIVTTNAADASLSVLINKTLYTSVEE